MTTTSLINLSFLKPLSAIAEPGSNRAALDGLVKLTRDDPSCRFLYIGIQLDNDQSVVLLVGWNPDHSSAQRSSTLKEPINPHLSSPLSVRQLEFDDNLNTLTTAVPDVPCDIITLHLPSSNPDLINYVDDLDLDIDTHAPTKASRRNSVITTSSNGAGRRDSAIMISSGGIDTRRESVIKTTAPTVDTQGDIVGCYRAWCSSQPSDEDEESEESEIDGSACDHVILIQHVSRPQASLPPKFLSTISDLASEGIAHTLYSLDFSPVMTPYRRRSSSVSANERLASASSERRGSTISDRRSSMISERSERRSSVSSSDLREEDVGKARELRKSLTFSEAHRFKFEVDSDDEDEDEDDEEEDGGVGLNRNPSVKSKASSMEGSELDAIGEEEEDLAIEDDLEGIREEGEDDGEGDSEGNSYSPDAKMEEARVVSMNKLDPRMSDSLPWSASEKEGSRNSFQRTNSLRMRRSSSANKRNPRNRSSSIGKRSSLGTTEELGTRDSVVYSEQAPVVNEARKSLIDRLSQSRISMVR
ncbi:MAG: hypothetical protein M1820_006254 [Bogoriella megaspora]|nr:MAG: hypothetical protein M1820_006254 [Bogoriella megaspora]